MRTSLLHLYTLVCALMKMVSDNHNEMSHSIFGVLGKDRDAQAIPIQYQNYFYSKANKKKNKKLLLIQTILCSKFKSELKNYTAKDIHL